MSLQEIIFTLTPQDGYETIAKDWSHTGVSGSGDLEVLLKRKDAPDADIKITTPVRGFDEIWKAVVSRAVAEACVGGVSIEINDNNATPFVAAMRLKQGFIEAKMEAKAAKGGGGK